MTPTRIGTLPELAALGVAPTRRDHLLQRIAVAALDVKTHQHGRPDAFCLHLTAWIGERAAAILGHVAALEAENEQIQAQQSATRGELDALIREYGQYVREAQAERTRLHVQLRALSDAVGIEQAQRIRQQATDALQQGGA